MSEGDEKILKTCNIEVIDTTKGGQVAGWRNCLVTLTSEYGINLSIETSINKAGRVKSLLEDMYVLMIQDKRL